LFPILYLHNWLLSLFFNKRSLIDARVLFLLFFSPSFDLNIEIQSSPKNGTLTNS
jgi:hypothetical protein